MRARMESMRAVAMTGSIIAFEPLGYWVEEEGGELGEFRGVELGKRGREKWLWKRSCGDVTAVSIF